MSEPLIWASIGVLATGAYVAIFRGIRVRGLWKMFLQIYVPEERRSDKRLRVAFACYNIALFLWLFRIAAWFAEAAFHALPEKDLIELTNGVLGAVYAIALLGAVIFVPYVRRRIDRLEGGP